LIWVDGGSHVHDRVRFGGSHCTPNGLPVQQVGAPLAGYADHIVTGCGQLRDELLSYHTGCPSDENSHD